jgi:hypothetical protein
MRDYRTPGLGGRGHIAAQGMLGDLGLTMGSPSTTFSNALSQVQVKAFEIVDSDQGDELRCALMDNILNLRVRLTAHGLEVYGEPCAIVEYPAAKLQSVA